MKEKNRNFQWSLFYPDFCLVTQGLEDSWNFFGNDKTRVVLYSLEAPWNFIPRAFNFLSAFPLFCPKSFVQIPSADGVLLPQPWATDPPEEITCSSTCRSLSLDGRWVAAAEIFTSARDFGMVPLGDGDGNPPEKLMNFFCLQHFFAFFFKVRIFRRKR